MSDTPPPIGSIWRSASGRVYVVVNNRIAHGAGWYVWVENRQTPFSRNEWETARMRPAERI
jgi:hypothetical protein